MSEAAETQVQEVTEVPLATLPTEPAISGQKEVVEEATTGKKADTTTDDSPEKHAGQRRFEKRIAAANRKYYEEKARAEFFEKQIAELKPKAPADAGVPKLEQFSDIEEYANAKAKYASEQVIKEREAADRTNAQKQTQQQLMSEWEKKADRGSSKYEDFEEVVGNLQPVNALVAAVMEADNAEDVAYYLAKHPQEAGELAKLGPLAQIRAVGRLEAKLLSEAPKPKTPSKAPAPITPVGGKSGGSSDLPQDSDDINTWMKKANAESKRKMSGA